MSEIVLPALCGYTTDPTGKKQPTYTVVVDRATMGKLLKRTFIPYGLKTGKNSTEIKIAVLDIDDTDIYPTMRPVTLMQTSPEHEQEVDIPQNVCIFRIPEEVKLRLISGVLDATMFVLAVPGKTTIVTFVRE